ncbi:type II secretion system protein [Nocardioides sp. MAH-18]|uniref:Type II secretion system protein n=1 Tax=Nocardioides agri TaxID=2682843 RepID=A0A6L6XUG0_9ACTN|nr:MULTISPECIES: type II secretion system F family protein [unclassified Nocardioides]MBA2955417.1 type II secretion system F family protein [Nocardioides sp. CGMCC 1.13656]MVQ50267.1 type II secretion system protein [Nocardioides sp. MAH-18]
MTAVAVLAAALSAGLLVRPPPRARVGRWDAGWRAAVPMVAGVALLLVVTAPRVAAALTVLVAAAAGIGALVRRRRDRLARQAASARVLETCDLLSAELAAGQPPGECLDRAAAAWPPLAPVAAAFHVGSDVPSALRAVAREVGGAGELRVVAAAWQVGHRTGDGLAATVGRVAESLRERAATRRVVAGELASARATARLLAGLPVVALAMGSGVGGSPWGFLLGTAPGLACLAAGLAFGIAGLGWIEAIARDAEDAA